MTFLPKTFAMMIAGVLGLGATACFGQSFAAPGSSWSSNWSYGSATDRSVGLATAQAVLAARTKPADNVTNIYNTTNTTSSVGSMNTGSTTVTVTGEGNTVTSSSGANTSGCVDGSLSTSLMENVRDFPLGPIDLSFLDLEPETSCQ
jgi:hypothetical protein